MVGEKDLTDVIIKDRLRSGWSMEEAISIPYRQRRDRENFIGKRYERLLVEKEVEPKLDPNGRSRRQFLCLCDCGKEVLTLGERLKSGRTKSCGCLAIELTKERNSKDLTGLTFGYLTAIRPVYSNSYGVHWLCLCKCGNTTIVIANNLLKGNTASCGCYNLESLTIREKAEIAGMRFGNVTAIECVGQNKYKNYLWKCICDCGTEFVVRASSLLTGMTQSCGCVHSRGEQHIAKVFRERGILFEKNTYFDDLRYKGYLFFDFMILDHDNNPNLIEYQGIQHYVHFPNGFGDQQRLITDPMKREYCKKKNIPLYEIRYDEDIDEKLNEIIAYVNPVLSKEV